MKIFLVGYMASGKSKLGVKLAKKLNYDFLDLDKCVYSKKGKTPADLIRENGEDYFREIECQILHEISEIDNNLVISCGGGTPCFFDNMEFMNRKGITIWLKINKDFLFSRLCGNNGDRPIFPLRDGYPNYDLFDEQYTQRCKFYGLAKIIAEKSNVDKVFDILNQKCLL